MSQESRALRKNPPLEPAQDFYRLRREGVGYIEKLGSKNWTDYNVHDPGITILEAASYTITDLAYRIDWKIEDILAPASASTDPLQPFPNQAFFTARTILTVNPVTPDDFRRVLIDLEDVRNAWVICKECACDASYFAWCEDDKLVLSYTPKPDTPLEPVTPRGLYEALLELENDPELGDLHDRKIESRMVFHDASGAAHPILLELRFPDISRAHRDQWDLFLQSEVAFSDEASFKIVSFELGAAKDFDVFTDASLHSDEERDAYIRGQWRNLLYATFEIEIDGGKKITIPNAALRLISDTAAKNGTTAKGLRDVLTDRSAAGFIRRYRTKALRAREAVQSARKTLQAHRNLDEDYCVVQTVGVEEVAVCADVEVRPDADIESVQAQIWFEIEDYFNPPVHFHTLQGLREAGEAVEEIFDGPELESGFITASDLKSAALKPVLRVSDILNRLMDIEGVVAVNRLLLTRHDAEGNVVRGVADPTWDADGNPVFDLNLLSASWLLFISSRHQPRLYLNQSRFLFYKNGLPFMPRMDEAKDTLQQLRGEAERPKNPNADKDLKIPVGTFRNPEAFYPVQYGFPLAYGIGEAGLPSTASTARRAQAKQLKAYLMVFEQLLANSLAQLAHTADLFSFDPRITRTYFFRLFSNADILGFDTVKGAEMTAKTLAAMTETEAGFYARRNRFLDHLVARFGEDFSEYALLLTSARGEKVAQQRLVENKIALLKRYPKISHDRAKAFDYTREPCSGSNYPGIKKRINLLLGNSDLSFVSSIEDPGGGEFSVTLQLRDAWDTTWFKCVLKVVAANEQQAKSKAYRAAIRRMVLDSAYELVAAGRKVRLTLNDELGEQIGQHPEEFDTEAQAIALRNQLMAWSASERLIVVEHLLLRPKFPGDALFPACSEGECSTCGDEDPYSFRLTFVMPGWVDQYTDNLDLRRFAERTIQQLTPSHLVGKTCWVGNDGFIENPCEEVVGRIADLLIEKGLTSVGVPPAGEEACACSKAIYHAFSTAFTAWYEDKTLAFIHEEALAERIRKQVADSVSSADVQCTTVLDVALWDEVLTLITRHFTGVALRGWQFERFEDAWCEWLDANAAIDWPEEDLLPRVEAMLKDGLKPGVTPASTLCEIAQRVLREYGTAFFDWMKSNVMAGNTLKELTDFVPAKVVLTAQFKPGTDNTIAALLAERYAEYKTVSYQLWIVLNLLAGLRSTYPGATLHDCDDGSDHNPVRLDNTALGNYPLRKSLT